MKVNKHAKPCQLKSTYSATHTKKKYKWCIVEKEAHVPLSDLGRLAEVCAVWKALSEKRPVHPHWWLLSLESDCCSRPCKARFWMGARPFICSPQGCSYFHVGDPSTLCCRWPRPPSFLSMAKKRPPASIEPQWRASVFTTHLEMMFAYTGCYVESQWVLKSVVRGWLSCEVTDNVHLLSQENENTQTEMSAWRGSSGIAGIDRSGLIGGNGQIWVKGLWLGSDPRLFADRLCVLTICRATESFWNLQAPLGIV